MTHDLICILEGISGCSIGRSLGKTRLEVAEQGGSYGRSRQEMMVAYRGSLLPLVLILPLMCND